MGLELEVSIPMLTVFIQGIFSFFSPCILPIIPLYIGYLSGGTTDLDASGQPRFNQKKVMLNTFFFIMGVSFAFFLLGIGFSAAGQFFVSNQMLFSRIGGILVVCLGLMQLGVFDAPFKGRVFKLPVKINTLKMNPLTALLMGFTFSFAWTPCVGPALSTVLIMISSAKTVGTGMMLMGIYTLGFTLPFLLVGVFTTKCLNAFKRHQKLVGYTVKAGGLLMVLMGVMMFTGIMNGVTGYLSTLGNSDFTAHTEQNQETEIPDEQDDVKEVMEALPFELKDQYGEVHTLEQYKGKVIFLNFWATWCPPCREEMPDIEKLYKSYGYNEEDVVVLGVVTPNDENKYTQEGSEASVVAFLESHNYTYPTLMDRTGELTYGYGISAYPTTMMIDVNGNLFGYVPGMITYDIMENIVEQTLKSTQ